MLTLHPQSAMEHLHHRFVAAGGAGSDGAIAFEATEVSATTRGRAPVPVRPAEPLAGAPDRSPIPLADNVQAAGRRRDGRGRQRQGRRRRGASSAVVAPGPGPAAAPQARLSAGHAARLAPRDAAAGRAGDPRPGHRRRRAGPRGLRVRRARASRGDQLGQRRAGGARHRQGGPRGGHRARASTWSRTTRSRPRSS